ncbi:MAG: hypothetical protein JO223_17895 [Hyphomicrobiales bacterium]|nr:hypothetical protein [Hyphomicrobiales bacterium]
MKILIKTVLMLGVILAVPVTGYAGSAEGPHPAHRTMHHHKGALAKATALAAPPGAVVAPPAPLPETDGLSRRDEDCNMGCIDH